MKKLIFFLLNPFLGKKSCQRFFEKLHLIALYGQNYGRQGDYHESGETKTIAYILNRLKDTKEAVIFDVGANVGNYSKYILERCRQDTLVYSFEPAAKTFQKLNGNLHQFPNSRVFNIGFGKENETVNLYTNEEITTHSSLIQRDMSHWGKEFTLNKIESVQIQKLDDFCRNNQTGNIDFLKIDVEGNEYNLLTGASEMLKNKRIAHIQFEFGVCTVDGKFFMKDIFSLLSKDYTIYRILKDGIYELPTYNEKLEVFLTTNYLAVLKHPG